MIKQAIEHRNLPGYIYPNSRRSLVFRIRAARGDIRSCRLVYWPRTKTDPADRKSVEMTCIQRDDLFDYFRAEVGFEKTARYTKYYFVLADMAGETLWLSAFGLQRELPEDGFFEYLYVNGNDVIREPEWACGQIYYQIFPERFYNGDPSNDPENTQDWESVPTPENFVGGDLAGIIGKLDYISDLGADCIYLNPVFAADFNHKYATTDYCRVDPQFGTNEDLKNLVAQCHARGMRIVLDGVFNHCGIRFAPFCDLLEKQEQSAYRDWFYVTRYPVEVSEECYECVGGYKWMPKLRSSNPDVRAFILDVMKFWIREAGIDGWRLDVADEVDRAVWQYARCELKEMDPDLLLIGETWGDASRMLQGDQMDSVMNYVFRDAARDFFAYGKITPCEFDARINRMLACHAEEINGAMYNLLDSHDTVRFLRECGDDTRKLKLAAAFQMLFCGSPAVYYGDEIGMTGNNDPDCRKSMIWDDDKRDKDIYDWYRKLIGLRKREAALRAGSFRTILCGDGNVFGFVREKDGEKIFAIMNNSPEATEITVPLAGEARIWEDLLTGGEYGSELLDPDAARTFYNHDLLEYSQSLVLAVEGYSVKVLKNKMEV